MELSFLCVVSKELSCHGPLVSVCIQALFARLGLTGVINQARKAALGSLTISVSFPV